MNQLTGACIIGQSGGPTAVINASAQGVIQTALKTPCITQVLGAAHGIKGVLEDKLYDRALSLIRIWPHGAPCAKYLRMVPVMARRRSESILILHTAPRAA